MPTIILLNKPFMTLSQFTNTTTRTTLADYIAEPGFYPAGRLDYESEGLLILTNDGRMQAKIANPHHKMSKAYWVQVEGIPDETALQQLRQGIQLKDGLTLPAKAKMISEPPILWPRNPPIRKRKNIPTQWVELTLTEGRNRQVRRMTAAVGYPCLRLIRYRIGSWTLDGLAPGESRKIEI